jgi:hypothetical protein
MPHGPILLVEYKNTRLVPGCFLGRITPEIHDRDAITNFPEMRGRAVELDHTFVRLTINNVSLEAFAVAQVANENLLVFAQINQLSQVGRNRETAFVMQTRARNRGAMNLRFQDGQLHLTCLAAPEALARDDAGLFQCAIRPVFVNRLESSRRHPDAHEFFQLRYPHSVLVQVRVKFTSHIFRDMATDAAFLFRHTTAMNDAAARDTQEVGRLTQSPRYKYKNGSVKCVVAPRWSSDSSLDRSPTRRAQAFYFAEQMH